jgi:hypothetical protein
LAGSVVSEHYSDTFKETKKQNRFKKLEGVHKLERSIIRQNMHNAMSPISAISGYLELINMSLEDNPDVERIEYYRKKIESGVNEVNNIIEQLQGIYSQELMAGFDDDGDDLIDVELNWMIQEVCNQMQSSTSNVTLSQKAFPLHVRTDLFIAKLIIFNLINYTTKSSCKGDDIQLVTDNDGDAATLTIHFSTSDRKKEELSYMFKNAGNKEALQEVEKNSFNEGLINSIKLAKEIYSNIGFLSLHGGNAVLKLSMPLAG